jgi:hypothetical protein
MVMAQNYWPICQCDADIRMGSTCTAAQRIPVRVRIDKIPDGVNIAQNSRVYPLEMAGLTISNLQQRFNNCHSPCNNQAGGQPGLIRNNYRARRVLAMEIGRTRDT